MIISRGEMLVRLTEASVGLSTKEVLEQSNSFVFKDDKLITFNDAIMARVANPLDFNAVVNAHDLLGILDKIPDDDVTITLQGDEIRIKGKRRTAGIICSADVHLPITAVPAPEKWTRLVEGTLTAMQQAARTCGNNETQYLSTCVHMAPTLVEACDNQRLLRVDGKTGFTEEVLIPAASVAAIEGLDLVKVSIGRGWVYFKTQSGSEISVRCSHEPYHSNIDELLVVEDPESITLPSNLKEIIERAEVFNTAAYDALLNVSIADGELKLTSRKEGGWYRERKKLKYSGRELNFNIHPKFLTEILGRTRDVCVGKQRMKIVVENTQFIVWLSMKTEEADEEAPF